MTLSVLLLISSVALMLFLPAYQDGPGQPGDGDEWIFVGSVVATIVFGLLTMAHFVTLVLRKTAWAPDHVQVFDRRLPRR